jgi:multiple sugar transport system ATP-binding protein
MAFLQLNGVEKYFGEHQVIKGINLQIQSGEFVVFVGPSGCGKSTLLRLIAGLEAVDAGSIVLDGRDITQVPSSKRDLAMVFQSYALYPHLSVFENIAFPLRVARLPEAEVKQKVGRAADILQLTEKLPLKPGQLSGGQRQRVAIGRSIVRNPKVFLFDEPLSNLDAALRGEMRVELSALQRDLDATMVYVTHDQIEAMTMAHRIVVLNKGRIEQFGTPMELYHHPATKFVATFIGQPNMNLIPATVIGTGDEGLTVELHGGIRMTLPVDAASARTGDTVEVGIRPESLQLGTGVTMRLRVLERLGGTAIAYGQMADGLKLCAALSGDTTVHEGEDIGLTFTPADAHVFDTTGRVMRRRQAPALAA